MYQFTAAVRAGKNGEIRHSGAICLQSWLTQPVWGHWRTDLKWLWRDSTAHGFKGGPGGIGIHILDFATCISGQDAAQVSCLLKVFDKVPGGRIGGYVLTPMATQPCGSRCATARWGRWRRRGLQAGITTTCACASVAIGTGLKSVSRTA
ncbi:hypothetical protein [uncultured Paracoccus sp.]|uniref:hypothetical protein n=1 Tax=uncultured Paracoccus sp. TaxID=189685 RepID=UPI0025973B9D|nr:hypothetical protein [uncultured Paracoccus sp.]